MNRGSWREALSTPRLKDGRIAEPESAGAVGNTAFGQIVGSEFNGNGIAGQDADVVLAHFPRNVGGDDVPIFQLYTEHRIGKGFDDFTGHLYVLFFRHDLSCEVNELTRIVP